MAEVTINGHTYSDDSHPDTGLAGGGHRQRFIPALQDVVAVAATVETSRQEVEGNKTTVETKAGEAASNAALAAQKAGEAVTNAATAATKAAEAAASAAAAAAVATGGTATLTPEAGKIPLASADAQIAHGWVAPPALPRSRPSLLLDFKKGHIDPRITFTRASAATYWDNQGVLRSVLSGEPRIDHDPITGACLGLLIEEARTNIILQSADPAQWTAGEATADGTVIAPNGASVSIWLASTNAISHRLTRTGLSGAAGNLAHAASIFVYIPPGSDVIRLILRARAGGDGQLVNVNVAGSGATAVFTFASSSPFGATAPAAIIAANFHVNYYGGGWHRLWYDSPLSTATTAASQIDISFSSAASELTAGTVNTRVAFWQGQLEAGSFATSPIITAGAAVTRAAEIATMVGANFSSWYRQSEGTVVCTYRLASDLADVNPLILEETTMSRMRIVGANSGGTGGYAFVIKDSVTQTSIPAAVAALENTLTTLAFAYRENDFAASRNGAAVTTDAVGSLVTPTFLSLTGPVLRVAYYPWRLSNAELVALSA